jgi:hypothetical protein
MRYISKKASLMVVILLMASMMTGCAAALVAGGIAIGAASYAYIQGDLEAKYLTDFDTAKQASLTALETMQFEILNVTSDAISGKIESRRSDGTPIRVKLETISSNIISIRVRVGLFGDRVVSERVQAAIQKNIPPPPRRE